jgi:hypothetical protein
MSVMAPPKRTRPTGPAQEGPGDDSLAEATAKPKRRGKLVQLYLDDATDAALESLRAAQRFPPERTQVCLRALMELLEREGFWPPTRTPRK